MTDWAHISVADFDAMASSGERINVLTGSIVLDRLPYTFPDKSTYFAWRDRLAQGLDVDARDVILVGSCATGRSLSHKKGFGMFGDSSDVDVAVISGSHFDQAWGWFRSTNPVVVGLSPDAQEAFADHRKYHVFDGVIAADEFLSYFSFGPQWLKELQRSEEFLPAALQGRSTSIRIYRDSAALRAAQARVLREYREHLGQSDPIGGAAT